MSERVQFTRHTHGTIAGQRKVGLFHSGDDSARGMWLPRATTFGAGTLCVPAAPAANSYDGKIERGGIASSDGAQVGSTISLAAPDAHVRGAYDAALPQALDGSTSGAGGYRCYAHVPQSGAVTNQIVFKGYVYEVADPNEDLMWVPSGDEAFNWSIAASDRFYGMWMNGLAGSSTEANTHIPWPVDGVFQVCLVRHNLAAASTVELVLRINGVDSALALTLTGNATAQIVPNETAVAVAAGDLVGWRYKRTAGAATTMAAVVMLGFRGDF